MVHHEIPNTQCGNFKLCVARVDASRGNERAKPQEGSARAESGDRIGLKRSLFALPPAAVALCENALDGGDLDRLCQVKVETGLPRLTLVVFASPSR